MNYRQQNIIDDNLTKLEKNDDFWFSDKLEDWYGLHPRIRAKANKPDIYEQDAKRKTDYRNQPRFKKSYYNSEEAAKYCNVSAATFLRRFRESGIKPASTGAKKYSFQQVKDVEKIINRKKIFASKHKRFDAAKISEYTEYSIDQVKTVMCQKDYSYMGMKTIERRLKKKYKLK